MDRSSVAPRDAAAFLCSPIPRDPTQMLFMDDSAATRSSRKTPSSNADSIFDRDADDAASKQTDNGRATSELASISSRLAKRPRLEAESAAIVKRIHQSEQLVTEVEALRLQLSHRRESHQLQLKERDLLVNQLRRQLQYAVAEEESTRQELKALSTEYANEKLQLQKKAVELESKLLFVESSFSEWREKADDAENHLRSALRDAKLQVQLLQDEVDALQAAARVGPSAADQSVLESQVALLETSLRDKELAVQQADARVQQASATLETAQDVRTLTERIATLESQERRLKQELVALIDSSRTSAVQDERLTQARQKLQVMEQRHALAQQEIASLTMRHEAAQASAATLHGDKTRLEGEVAKLKAVLADARATTQQHKHQAELSLVVAREWEQKAAAAARSLGAMHKANEELVAILDSYKTDEGGDATVSRLHRVLEESSPIVRQLEALAVALSASSTVASVGQPLQDELLRLKQALEAATLESKRLAGLLDKAEAECAALELRVGRGEFNADTTKVVHLAVNPTSEQLRATASAATLTTTTSYETVEAQKLLNQRLKEVFQNQIQQYREAVYQLTGYKVDLKKSSGVELLRLRSMYADHEDDELLVRMEPSGALELLETSFCAHIDKRVFAYLTTCRSFPAFLSTLTLHLFEKKTFQG